MWGDMTRGCVKCVIISSVCVVKIRVGDRCCVGCEGQEGL